VYTRAVGREEQANREGAPRKDAVDLDSAGVYFMDVADFEWRPAREPDPASSEEPREDNEGLTRRPPHE
jgi:hypothetical protein